MNALQILAFIRQLETLEVIFLPYPCLGCLLLEDSTGSPSLTLRMKGSQTQTPVGQKGTKMSQVLQAQGSHVLLNDRDTPGEMSHQAISSLCERRRVTHTNLGVWSTAHLGWMAEPGAPRLKPVQHVRTVLQVAPLYRTLAMNGACRTGSCSA